MDESAIDQRSVYIYRDEGVCPFSYKHTFKSVKESLADSPITVKKITHQQIVHEESWILSAALLIMPGGRDIPYFNKLKGEGNKKISRYVREGGRYLGICAGAYYGSKRVVFAKGLLHEVIDERELCFFPGDAIGPLYDPNAFSYENEDGERASSISFKKDSFSVYYKGGCYFSFDQKLPSHVDVLGYFEDLEKKHPAIVLCKIGKGKALLSGVHPEVNLESYVGKGEDFNLIDRESELKRKTLFKNLINEILE